MSLLKFNKNIIYKNLINENPINQIFKQLSESLGRNKNNFNAFLEKESH